MYKCFVCFFCVFFSTLFSEPIKQVFVIVNPISGSLVTSVLGSFSSKYIDIFDEICPNLGEKDIRR